MNQKRFLFIISVLMLSILVTACGPLGFGGTGREPLTPSTPIPDPSGEIKGLAVIVDVETIMLESVPVQVNALVKGNFPDSCTLLDEIIQTRDGNTIKITVTTIRPASDNCVQVLTPFEKIIPLDVVGLEAGRYTVKVNSVTDVFEFSVDNVLPIELASISGKVWHDQCAVAGGEGGIPLTPSKECVQVNNAFQADGVMQSSEPGLSGVVVELGAGNCPTSGLAETRTDSEGVFTFGDLQPGTYCVSIDPLWDRNVPLLIPGQWTYPALPGQASISVSVEEGDEKNGVNFGWDFEFLPEPPVLPTPMPTTIPPTPTPTAIPALCDHAQFVKDISVADGTSFLPGTPFVKTWRLKNIGTCTWTKDYDLVFVSGSLLSADTVMALPQTVKPGESVDLSVEMRASQAAGRYRGNWMLRNEDGKLFGIGDRAEKSFWVDISVSEVGQNKYPYDFAANMCLASWRSSSSKLVCSGSETNKAGSVILLDRPILENGRKEDELTIWMRPEETSDGWIMGTYPVYKVKEGDYFMAMIGCLEGYKNCEVNFRLDYQIDGGKVENLMIWRESYDGAVTTVEVDLSSLAGKSVQFILKVTNLEKPAHAQAFWLGPSIRNDDYEGPGRIEENDASLAAREMIADYYDVGKKKVMTVSIEGPVEWQDSCLGVNLPGKSCSPASISGYRVILSYNDRFYEAHTNKSGSIVWWFQLVQQ
ncbi:MAG: NBR1-Ig-like domain-containing protein [Anaerolineales bacterium]